MRQTLMAFALMAMASLVGYAADEKKEDKKTEEVSFAELRKDFMAKFQKGDADEKKAAFKEYGPKFAALAEKKGADEEGFGAAMFAIQIGGMGKLADVQTKALAVIKKNHLGNKGLKTALPAITRALGNEATPFMKELMEKGGTTDLKATACSTLLEGLETRLADAKGEEATKIKKEMAELRKIGVDKFKMKDLFIGAQLPDLKSVNLDGKDVKLSDYKGKVVVLDIWATWCPPCRAMIPHERELVERMKNKPFALVSISFDEEKDTLVKFLEKEKMPWSHWWNGKKGEIGSQLNVRFFPTMFVLDGKGVIRYKGVRGKALDKAVDTLLAEVEGEKKSS